jgi:hypothetical protein
VKGLKPTLISVIAMGLLAGSAVGVAAQDEDPMAPSTFTGEGTEEPAFSTDPETGLTIAVATFEATDSRASGTWTQVEDPAVVEGDDGRQYQVGRVAVRLVNDGGSWVGTHQGFIVSPLAEGPPSVGFFSEMAGEDGYEGLSLFLVDTFTSDGPIKMGVIVPSGAVHPFPEPPPAE